MKILKTTCLILGCFLGAGFVSGREIASYFSIFKGYSIIGIIIVMFLLFFLIKLFFALSKNTSTFSGFVNNYFGESGKVVNWMLALSLFILIGSMFAGSMALSKTINFNEFLFALMTGGACYFVVVGNLKLLENINFILVPIIILVLVFVCGLHNTLPSVNNAQFNDIILSMICSTNYVLMNIVTLGLLILETGGNYTKKEATIISIISSLVVCVLLFICNSAIIKYDVVSTALPVLTIATTKGFLVWAITALTIWIGLFTTIISCVFVLSRFLGNYIKNIKLNIIVILVTTMLFSMCGFVRIVSYIYWIIGGVGLILVFSVIHKKFKSKITSFKHKKYSKNYKKMRPKI